VVFNELFVGAALLLAQCGFSSTVEGNTLTHEQQTARLRLIAQTAAEVRG
jgi:5-methyltetrahydropteroyltriglutamate--homocysteine methyltransferase